MKQEYIPLNTEDINVEHFSWWVRDVTEGPFVGCKQLLSLKVNKKTRYSHYSVKGKCYVAHRVAWTVANGFIPKDQQLKHLCKNSRCVNVDHLKLMPVAIPRIKGSKRVKSICVKCNAYIKLLRKLQTLVTASNNVSIPPVVD